MAEETQQDGQKTLVAFVVGLLIGGMLVWAFSGPDADAPTTEEDTQTSEQTTADDDVEKSSESDLESVTEPETATELPQLQVGNGDVVVNNQPASTAVVLASVVYPISEGWIAVREYNNDKLGYILGAARFSESQGLVPSEVPLLRSTSAGKSYAIVIYTEDGDREFSLASDVQIDKIFDTFVAQ